MVSSNARIGTGRTAEEFPLPLQIDAGIPCLICRETAAQRFNIYWITSTLRTYVAPLCDECSRASYRTDNPPEMQAIIDEQMRRASLLSTSHGQ